MTDNAKNMSKMSDLLHEEQPDILAYGYIAHSPTAVTKHVIQNTEVFSQSSPVISLVSSA